MELIIEIKFLTANVFIQIWLRSRINRDTLILQCMSDRPVANISKWSPRKYKINLVRTVAYRCIRICSSPRLLQLALDDLKRILLLNGYPMGTVKYHMNDVIVKHQNKPKDPVQTVKRKEVRIVLPFLGYHSKHLTKQLRSCINKCYGIFNVKIVFQSTRRIKSFFPYKDKLLLLSGQK